jgi:TolB-like protein
MKYFYFLFMGALCIIGACAAGDHQKQAALSEQRASSVEFDRQIDILAQEIIDSLDVQKTHKIAVIEFPNLEGNVSDLGKYLAEELTTRLFRTGRFQMIERQLMKRMMEEQKLNASGLIDEQSASKLGRMLGVDALTTGTIAELNTGVKINARLIAVETGAVFAVASVKIPMSREIERLLGRKPAAVASSDAARFDGTWDVSIACPPKGEGIGYTVRLTALVKDGVLHGQSGTDARAPLALDGKINPDGNAVIRAKGLTGEQKHLIRNSYGKGMPYSYHVDASFSGLRGTGTRIEGRGCNLLFFKQ